MHKARNANLKKIEIQEITNFIFSTLKMLLKVELCQFNLKNASHIQKCFLENTKNCPNLISMKSIVQVLSFISEKFGDPYGRPRDYMGDFRIIRESCIGALSLVHTCEVSIPPVK